MRCDVGGGGEELAKERFQWRALVLAVLNLEGSATAVFV
jgi:hypothetical protein